MPWGNSIRTTVAAAMLIMGLLAAVPSPASASAPDPTHPYRSGYVLVGYRDGVSPAARADVRGRAGVALSRQLMPSADLLTLPVGLGVGEAIARLERDPRVAYAEPDYLLETTATSDDPYYTGGSLWGMYGDTTTNKNVFGSQAGEAWDAGYTGSSSVVIGVIDEGIDITHPDLAANIWKNPGESGGGKETNGVDDDKNGYVDDVNGWDFYNNDKTVFDAGGDSHGTHVAGTIGAKGGNGIGVAGVNWDVRLISAKFLGPLGGYTSGAISALRYLTNLKTRGTNPVNIVAINNSWGGGGFSQAMLDAINAAGSAGMLFIVAAGNDAKDNDMFRSYPSSYVCTTSAPVWGDCIISVASITETGSLSSFSNYGAVSVDLGAPGSSIWSTVPDSAYGSYSGTSMATPHVTGAAALCASISMAARSSATPPAAYWVRRWILDGTATTSLAGKTSTGDRLDIGRLKGLCTAAPALPASYPLAVGITGSGSVTATATEYENFVCSSSCTKAYLAGAVVRLTIKAGPGQKFKGWGGACLASGTTTSCTVTLSALRNVTATFGK